MTEVLDTNLCNWDIAAFKFGMFFYRLKGQNYVHFQAHNAILAHN